jgi:hypothetical protein
MLEAHVVWACKCAMPSSAKEGLEKSKAVFSGKVIGVSKSKWTFKVIKIWKGDLKSRVTLYDSMPETSCASNFKVGESYLIYASTSKIDDRPSFIPDVCNRTKKLEDAKDDLRELGEGSQP